MHNLIVTAKMYDIDPQAWLADVLARIAGHSGLAARRLVALELATSGRPHQPDRLKMTGIDGLRISHVAKMLGEDALPSLYRIRHRVPQAVHCRRAPTRRIAQSQWGRVALRCSPDAEG